MSCTVQSLFPVLTTILQLSKEEQERIKKKRASMGGFFSAIF